MRIAIYGAGAIGGLLAVQLAGAGENVVVVARGPKLDAIRAQGLRLLIEGGERVARVDASDDPAAIGPVDVLILALKANLVPGLVDKLPPLLGERTCVVTAMNGIPFWYFYGLDSPFAGRRIEAVDPGGRLWETIGPERCIGCIVHPAGEIVAPGVVRHSEGDRFALGEPDGSRSERVAAIAQAFTRAGFKAPVRPRIRDELWLKLWGNLSFNPISALTGATLDVLASDPGVREVVRAMMVEAQAVGERLGARFALTVDKRMDAAKAVGAHRTSMLQDLEGGRELELAPLVTAVRELATLVDVPTPTIDAIEALTRLRARTAGISGI